MTSRTKSGASSRRSSRSFRRWPSVSVPVPTAIGARLRAESGARPRQKDPIAANVRRSPTRERQRTSRIMAARAPEQVVRAVYAPLSRFDLTQSQTFRSGIGTTICEPIAYKTEARRLTRAQVTASPSPSHQPRGSQARSQPNTVWQ